MRSIFIFAAICCIASISTRGQSTIKPDLFNKVPVAIKNCGALYTHDTTSLKKKKYILVADFQNKGIISIGGKQIPLLLTGSKLENGKINVSTYTGGGYTVVTSLTTKQQTKAYDLEEGTLEISKGKSKVTIKIHGQSSCDETKQEGNGG